MEATGITMGELPKKRHTTYAREKDSKISRSRGIRITMRRARTSTTQPILLMPMYAFAATSFGGTRKATFTLPCTQERPASQPTCFCACCCWHVCSSVHLAPFFIRFPLPAYPTFGPILAALHQKDPPRPHAFNLSAIFT